MRKLIFVIVLMISGCNFTPQEKKDVAKSITETTDAVAAVTPFPYDQLVYAAGGIVAALLGVGVYKKVKKPKA